MLDVEDLAELLEVLDQGANLNLTRQQQNLQQFFDLWLVVFYHPLHQVVSVDV